jgi:uroporphyrinogen decarboxylase
MVVPQAMNLTCIMVPGKGPTFEEPLIGPECLNRIDLAPNVTETLQYVYDAITLTRHKIDGQCPLYGFCGAPWTLMGYMIEGGGSKTHSKVSHCWE